MSAVVRQHLADGAWVELHPGFVRHHEDAMEELVQTLPLKRAHIVMFGKSVATPRLTSWHGDPGCAYRYSGRTFEPSPLTPRLDAMRDAIEAATGVRYNSVLANLYRDGNDAMGAHSDDEKELGPSPDDIRIASVSLGARRRFSMRPKPGVEAERIAFDLGEGDLLVMGGTTQALYKHNVPRTRRPVGQRLNLTFRVVVASRRR